MSDRARWTEAQVREFMRKHPDANGRFHDARGHRMSAPIVTTTDVQTLWIPGTMPGWNQLNDGHWTKRAALKRQWLRNIGVYIERAGIRPVDRAHITIACVEQNRRRDTDNVQGGASKIINDSLVAHGILIDDSPRYVTSAHEPVAYDAVAPGVRVTITPIIEPTPATKRRGKR
jgi:hypothetical protein